VNCPFCNATTVERVSQWGGQIITAQWRCQACNSYFEAVREDFDDRDAPPVSGS
jgi:transposase-like protein